MEQQTSLEILVEKAKQEFSRQGYGDSTQQFTFGEWSRLIRFARANSITHYSLAVGKRFKKFRCGKNITESHTNLPAYQKNCRRVIRILNTFYKTGKIERNIRSEKFLIPKNFQKITTDYLNYRATRIRPSSLRGCKRHIFRFIDFLHNLKIKDVNGITGKTISMFCQQLSGYDNCTIHTYICNLRSFLRYLYEFKHLPVDLSVFIPKYRLYQDAHIPTTWTHEEISRILAVINRGSILGKRDYAMILIIATLGMRIGDVINLKLDNLDWKNKQIKYIQKKNLEHQVLPISDEIGWAIIDYLKNGRPQSSSRYVFIKHLYPYNEFSEFNSFWEVFTGYRRKAGIQQKPRSGMHSLRHSLASTMLEQKTQLPVISSILGHTNPKSTNGYLKVSIDQLRKCSLSYMGKGGENE